MDRVVEKKRKVVEIKLMLSEIMVDPIESASFLNSIGSSILTFKQKASQLLLRPGIDLLLLMKAVSILGEKLRGYDKEELEQAEIQIKYEAYIEKEKELVTKMSQLENLSIPHNFNYDKLVSLSNEARQKFTKIQPRTLGQASRISGVNPSDVQILMLFMGR